MQHTSPPWYVENMTVWSANGKVLESPGGDIDQIEVDLQLASAAPDLLGACIDMLFVHSIISEYESCHCIACERTRAAIAKARGQV